MISNDTKFGYEKILGLRGDRTGQKKRSLEARADAFSRLKIPPLLSFFRSTGVQAYDGTTTIQPLICFLTYQQSNVKSLVERSVNGPNFVVLVSARTSV